MKHIPLVLALLASLAARAITTTLEYEDARETNTLAQAAAYTDAATNATVGAIAPIAQSIADAALTNATAYTDAAVEPLCTRAAAEAMAAAALSRTNTTLTAAGVMTDYLIDGSLKGGVRLRYSSRSEDSYTAYAYNGIAVRRDGATDDYLVGGASPSNIARLKDIATATNAVANAFWPLFDDLLYNSDIGILVPALYRTVLPEYEDYFDPGEEVGVVYDDKLRAEYVAYEDLADFVGDINMDQGVAHDSDIAAATNGLSASTSLAITAATNALDAAYGPRLSKLETDKADKADLAQYLPLSGGRMSGLVENFSTSVGRRIGGGTINPKVYVGGATVNHFLMPDYVNSWWEFFIQNGMSGNTTNEYHIALPKASGTLALAADIPAVPANVSAFANDAGYLTEHQDLSGKADASALASLQAVVSTYNAFVDGSNVVFSVTNYISGTYTLDSAKLRILELRDGAYHEVYNSRDEILLHVAAATNSVVGFVNNAANALRSALDGKADKAWGKYTSAGGEAPPNTVYMTAPQTVFAGGMEYERVAVGGGTICVLTTKGAPAYTVGDEGTFHFQDDGGTNYFGYAKSDSYTIGVPTDGISVDNNIVTLTYSLTMSGVPCIWYKAAIESDEEWEQLNTPDGSPVSGASHAVSWEASPAAGTEVCYLNVTGEPRGFFKATVEVAGEAKFMTNMPADFSAGILCADGQHRVRINYNNGSPVLEVVP